MEIGENVARSHVRKGTEAYRRGGDILGVINVTAAQRKIVVRLGSSSPSKAGIDRSNALLDGLERGASEVDHGAIGDDPAGPGDIGGDQAFK